MNEFASTEKIQQLEQRQEQLIDALETLNDRLERTLVDCTSPPEQGNPTTSSSTSSRELGPWR